MAASDYEVLSDGPLCPIGYLANAIGPTDTAIEIVGFQSVEGADTDLVIGMAVMVNDEIMRLNSRTLPTLSVSRGCADTLPAKLHPANSVVWFFDTDAGTDGREYTAASTIGVKLLPYTGGGGAVPVESAPPHALTFNWRFIRPYPPADIRCNGVPWDGQPQGFDAATNSLNLAWVHRNRVLQADLLIGHTEAGVTPETGTTYGITVHKQGGQVVRSVTVNVGTTWNYTISQALSDAVGATGYVQIESQRDGFTSLQKRVIELVIGAGIPQISEFIFGGTVEVGAVVTITLGATSFSYTIAAGDTLATVAWEMAELIKANGEWVVSASNGVVLITGKSKTAFTISGLVVGTGATTAAIVTVAQSATTMLPQITEVDFDTVIDDTLRLSVTIDSETFTYDVQAGEDSGDALAALAALINVSNEVPFTPIDPFTRVAKLNDGSDFLVQVATMGSTPRSHVMSSTDGGKTFSTATYTQSERWGGTRSTKYWDAKYGSRRFSILYSGDLGSSVRQVITQDGTDEPVATPVLDSYPNTGSALDGLDIFAAYADTDELYFIGAPESSSGGTNAYLYSTDDGLNATLHGQLTLDSGETEYLALFSATYMRLDNAKLVRYGTRWFFITPLSVYYCDEPVPVANWKRAQLDSDYTNVSFKYRHIEKVGSTIVVTVEHVQYVSLSYVHFVYSTDNGNTWVSVKTPAGTSTVFPSCFISTPTAFLAYFIEAGVPKVITATPASPSTWTIHTATGLSTLDYPEYGWNYNGSVVMIYLDGEIVASDDGINFIPSVVPTTVTVTGEFTATVSGSFDKLVIESNLLNAPFTASAGWSLKPTTAMTYQTIRDARDLGYATGMGEALGVNLGGLPA